MNILFAVRYNLHRYNEWVICTASKLMGIINIVLPNNFLANLLISTLFWLISELAYIMYIAHSMIFSYLLLISNQFFLQIERESRKRKVHFLVLNSMYQLLIKKILSRVSPISLSEILFER